MNQLHIHEVLQMMLQTNKKYNDKLDFVKDINQKFGFDVRFFACSENGMNADAAFDFLIRKGKINLDTEKSISLSPDMTMCDDDKHHDHKHDHNE